jgi:hypothetical protein
VTRIPKHLPIRWHLALVVLLAAGCGSGTTSTRASTSSTPSTAPNWVVAQAGHNALVGWLDGVACVTATNCVAVGNESSGNGYTNALVETLNHGSWSASIAPGAPSGQGAYLFSVSCPSLGRCVAVGYFLKRTGATKSGTMLIETLDNETWTVTPTPSPGPNAIDSFLYGVSCTTPSTCVAVGNTDAGRPSTSRPLSLSLANGKWVLSSAPNFGSQSAGLRSVSCSSPNRCVAVGYRTATRSDQTLIETRNGERWSITPSQGSGGLSPSGDRAPTGLNGVSCASAASCVAVGQLTGPVPTIEIKTNQTWTATKSPDPASNDPATGLDGVSCLHPTRCVAVGTLASTAGAAPDGAFGSPLGSLIETYSSGTWTIAASPPGLPRHTGLHAVSCADQACVAVGQTGQFTSSTPGTSTTLIVQTQ